MLTISCFSVVPMAITLRANHLLCACADVDLLEISVLEKSLYYINIRNCSMLTDDGISIFLMKCRKIHSMVLSYTSFGDRSIHTLCTPRPSDSTDQNYEHACVMAFNMQELHLDGCKGNK